jgi:hypothetical protein
MNGDGPDKQMIDTAGAVADFAYRQGVSDAIAVDHLIQRYRGLREERNHALDDLETLRVRDAGSSRLWTEAGRERTRESRAQRVTRNAHGWFLPALEAAFAGRGSHG